VVIDAKTIADGIVRLIVQQPHSRAGQGIPEDDSFPTPESCRLRHLRQWNVVFEDDEGDTKLTKTTKILRVRDLCPAIRHAATPARPALRRPSIGSAPLLFGDGQRCFVRVPRSAIKSTFNRPATVACPATKGRASRLACCTLAVESVGKIVLY
jgi:hypothetical protein